MIDAGTTTWNRWRNSATASRRFRKRECRSKTRRNGQPGLGPLTLETRRRLLDELLSLRAQTGQPLISDHEVRLIREQWEKDQTQEILWEIKP